MRKEKNERKVLFYFFFFANFNRMGETVTKIAFKMGESDPVRL